MAAPRFLTIGQMTARYQVTARALRFYEQRGLLAPYRQDSHRFYSAHDCIRLELISKGKRLGFSLGETKRVIDTMLASKVLNGETASAEFLNHINPAGISDRINALVAQRQDTQDAIDQLKAALGR